MEFVFTDVTPSRSETRYEVRINTRGLVVTYDVWRKEDNVLIESWEDPNDAIDYALKLEEKGE